MVSSSCATYSSIAPAARRRRDTDSSAAPRVPRRSSSWRPAVRGARNSVSFSIGGSRMRRTLYNWHDHLASRREFLTAAFLATVVTRPALGGGAVLQAPPAVGGGASLEAQPADLWDPADAILKRIAAPRFPQRTFEIRRYGATTTAD